MQSEIQFARKRTKFSSRGKPRRLPPERIFRQRSRRLLCSTNQRSQFRQRQHVYLRHCTAIQTNKTLQCIATQLYHVIYASIEIYRKRFSLTLLAYYLLQQAFDIA